MPTLRFCFSFQIVLLALLAIPTSHAFAHARTCRSATSRASSPIPDDEQHRPNSADKTVLYRTTEAPGHDHRPYRRALSSMRAGQRPRAALRHRRRPRRLPVAGPGQDHAQAGMAGLDAAAGDDPAPALSAALHGRRPGQSAGRARALSRHHGLSHPRHQPAADHRHRGLVGLLPPGQSAT